jgi:hypothetical protein
MPQTLPRAEAAGSLTAVTLPPVRRTTVVALLGLLALAPAASAASAAGKKRGGAERAKLLWATVSVCDTDRRPNTIGVRASMPGTGRRHETMWMRFQLQYRAADGRWKDVTGEGADSGRVKVGSARYKARQSGWEFPFQPQAGQEFLLRGVVAFEWRRGGRVVRRATKRTTGGRRPAVADPKGYSAATCRIAGAAG